MWWLFVKQEEITSGSHGEFMSLFCRKKECLQGFCHQLLPPRTVMWKKLWLKKHRLLSQFPGIPPPLLPSCIKTPYFCFFERAGFERSCSPVILLHQPDPINLSLTPSTSVPMFWPTRASGTWTRILGGDSATWAQKEDIQILFNKHSIYCIIPFF